MQLDEINIRDPFILPFEGKYYMYGSRVGTPYPGASWGDQTGFDVYISDDLKTWSVPKPVFEITKDFWATMHAWAPEVHLYQGKFYMLASFKAEGVCRGTHILVSDKPDGTFVPVSDKPITPADWECLDGTLYIDKKGQPHIVFCHEWLQIGNGTVCEMQLSEDLSTPVTPPRVLWSAQDFLQVKQVGRTVRGYVTDGPFLYHSQSGELLCIWSSTTEKGYAELISRSDNGDIDGQWQVCQTPLSEADGGHGMIFRDFGGSTLFVMHKPNSPALRERPVILPIFDRDGMLFLD